MARAKTVTGEVLPPSDVELRNDQIAAGRQMMMQPDPEPAPPPQLNEIEPDPDDVALSAVLAELGSNNADAKVNVHQLDPRTKARAFVGTFAPSEFTLEKLQVEFGPGDYEIRVYSTQGLVTRRVVKIATPKNAALVSMQPAVNDNTKLLEAMQNGFQQMSQMFANALGQLSANQPKPKSTLELLQEMQMMREIMGGNQPAQPAVDPMEMFRMATEIADKIHPREGEPATGEILLRAIESFGPVLANAAKAEAPSVPMIENATPVLGVPAQAAPQPLKSNPIPKEPDMNMEKFYLNMLISHARAGHDPMTYANMILDTLPDDKVHEFIGRSDWFAQLVARDARVNEYREWFEELKADIIELTTDDGDGIQEGTPPLNPSNVPSPQ